MEVWNKYSPVWVRNSPLNADYGKFHLVIDNNPASYACCLFHFCRMMRSYASVLQPGGAMITAEPGLSHVITNGDPEWSLKWDDWAYLVQHLALRPERLTEFVYSMEKDGQPDFETRRIGGPMSRSPLAPGKTTSRSQPSPGRRPERLRVIVMGWMVRGPLGGMAWHYLNYVGAFAELGHDVYYIEDCGELLCCDQTLASASTDPVSGCGSLPRRSSGSVSAIAGPYYDAHAGVWKGARAADARELCATADLVLNISGTCPLRDWFDHVRSER